jgi:hypothetical protein
VLSAAAFFAAQSKSAWLTAPTSNTPPSVLSEAAFFAAQSKHAGRLR